MNRTTWLQDRRMAKFCDVLSRWTRRELSALDASQILGCSERQFRRYRRRYEEEGLTGLFDKRLGRASARRVLSLSVCSPRSLASEYAEASSAASPNSRPPSSNGSIIETRTQNPSYGPRRPSPSFSNATAQKRPSPTLPWDANE